MEQFFNISVITDNFTYFMIGRFPHGPLGGVGLTLYLAVVSCILSFFGGLILTTAWVAVFAATVGGLFNARSRSRLSEPMTGRMAELPR